MLFQAALSQSKSRATWPSSLQRSAIAFAVLLPLALTPLAKPQAVAPTNSRSLFKSLDLKAARANDSSSISVLFTDIHNRNFYGPLPQSVLDRMVRAQEGFLKGTQPPVTEAAVASAVNGMGRELDPGTFTGTNALQVRFVRIWRLAALPTLLATGSPRPPDQIVAHDLSPAGAVYLGLFLLHQKLANPAWFGDPDAQNKMWITGKRASAPAGGATLRVREEPPEETNFRLLLEKGLASEGSSTTKAYHRFLDTLGIGK